MIYFLRAYMPYGVIYTALYNYLYDYKRYMDTSGHFLSGLMLPYGVNAHLQINKWEI